MCYPGQNFDMSVPVPEGTMLDEAGLLDLAERFHDQHESERGFCFRSQQPVVRGVRIVARGRTPETRSLRRNRRGHRRAAGAQGNAHRVLGRELDRHAGVRRASARFRRGGAGPALIEEPFTVVVLPPDAMARLDDMGNYVVTPQ